jgi:hypothetical protein
MMRDCQMYSRKFALSKTIINYSNRGFMLKTYRTDTFSSWKYTTWNYDSKFRCSIGTKYIRSLCYISKLELSPHKFTHPPPCCKWIRTFSKYGFMMPFSGITLQQNIIKISELLPDLWWWINDSTVLHATRAIKNSPSFVEIALIYSRKGKIWPCHSLSARRIFKFQSCYGVGCPEPNIQCLTTSLRKQRYVIYLSWKEEFYKKTYIYIYVIINDVLQTIS